MTGPTISVPRQLPATMTPMPTPATHMAIRVPREMRRRRKIHANRAQKTGAVYWSRMPTAAVEAVIDMISRDTTAV